MRQRYIKVAEVLAEQYVVGSGDLPDGVYVDGETGIAWLRTLEGVHLVRAGDYICTGVNGEQWNVEQGVFVKSYKPMKVNNDQS